jgi:hypothetical protein
VSRSGYHKWRKSRDGGPTSTQWHRAKLDTKVAKFHGSGLACAVRDREQSAPLSWSYHGVSG